MTDGVNLTVVSTNDILFPEGTFSNYSKSFYFGTSGIYYYVKSVVRVKTANVSTSGIHFL